MIKCKFLIDNTFRSGKKLVNSQDTQVLVLQIYNHENET